jgi:hypothetical protein
VRVVAAAWLQACDQQGGAAGKPLIYVGDLNVAAADVDLSHPSYFRNIQMDKQAQAKGGRGTIAPENRGQPGCTDNERRRFREMLDAGQLVDVYRRRQQQQQLGSEASASAASAAAAGGGSFGSDGSARCSDDGQYRCVRPAGSWSVRSPCSWHGGRAPVHGCRRRGRRIGVRRPLCRAYAQAGCLSHGWLSELWWY